MDGDKPIGDKWNFDQENRKSPPKKIISPAPTEFNNDKITEDVLVLVNERYNSHFGDVYPFNYAVTPDDANLALDKFIKNSLPLFGDYQTLRCLANRFYITPLFRCILTPDYSILRNLPKGGKGFYYWYCAIKRCGRFHSANNWVARIH